MCSCHFEKVCTMKRIDEQLKMKNIGPTAELKRIPDPITV